MAQLDPTANLLQTPSEADFQSMPRQISEYVPHNLFTLAKGQDKGYQQQYGDMYFLRLAQLKPIVEELAASDWEGFQLGSEQVHRVERVLDVRQGELCWVVGTVYVDLPLKPSILDDISKDHWIAAPPPKGKYITAEGAIKIMLEDESGRLRLAGSTIEHELLVTGCIIAVMGTENADGEFEVIDIRVPDLPSQTADEVHAEGGGSLEADQKVAFIGGLSLGDDTENALALDLLCEYLLGEAGTQSSHASASQIVRLVIVGNSLAEAHPLHTHEEIIPVDQDDDKKFASTKKYGYDASSYNAAPQERLDSFMAWLLPSLPITILPGPSDPANVSVPQQPLHPALFQHSRSFAQAPVPTQPFNGINPKMPLKNRTTPLEYPLDFTTNPTSFTLGNRVFLGHSGQPIHDMLRYLNPEPGVMELMEATLQWRLIAPTAPDTLWCYPYRDGDPFIVKEGACPDVYFTANCGKFQTEWIEGGKARSTYAKKSQETEGSSGSSSRVRCISIPNFHNTSEIVLLNLKTLAVELIRFGPSKKQQRGPEGKAH